VFDPNAATTDEAFVAPEASESSGAAVAEIWFGWMTLMPLVGIKVAYHISSF